MDYTKTELQVMADYNASQYYIPPEIFRGLISAESNWDYTAKAKPTPDNPNASAYGLTQMIKTTAKEMGVTNIYDPNQQLAGGARYLNKMYNKFGNWRDALRLIIKATRAT